ncbi:MAG: hypothetical protein LBC75_07555 [Fibromonadaceae bacterium]|jgi:hypothetical protein|nr:hypothetical protein [Fibromonadaceae bacterium]
MRKILFAATFALFASTQAFAIFGIGAHYVMNTGSLDKNEGKIPISREPAADLDITVTQKSASGLQGLGFKAWIDLIPVVDIEGTFNVAATRYKTSLTVPRIVETETGGFDIKDTTINLSYTPDAPYNIIFGAADPLYGVVNGDISVTYPFDLPIIRPYVGVGFSYFASIPIINASFTQKMLDENLANALLDPNDPKNADAASEIGKSLVKALQKESYTTGMGGHIIAGLRIKPPIIPLAVYANGKYYIGGNTNSQFSQGLVLEVGGGFAL